MIQLELKFEHLFFYLQRHTVVVAQRKMVLGSIPSFPQAKGVFWLKKLWEPCSSMQAAGKGSAIIKTAVCAYDGNSL